MSEDHSPAETRDSQPSAGSSRTTTSKGRATGSGSSAASRRADDARTVHLVLQGKGGIGKTYVASLIAESIAEKGEPLVCTKRSARS